MNKGEKKVCPVFFKLILIPEQQTRLIRKEIPSNCISVLQKLFYTVLYYRVIVQSRIIITLQQCSLFEIINNLIEIWFNMRVLSVRSDKLFFVVKMIVYSLKITGVAPFGVQIKSSAQISPFNSRIQAFRYSKIGLAYNILLLIPVLVTGTTVLSAALRIDPSQFSVSYIVSHVVDQVNVILCILTACLILINWGVRQRKAAFIMNQLLEVDLDLASFEKPPFNKRALIFLIIHVLLNTCFWISYWYTEVWKYRDFPGLINPAFIILPKSIIYWYIAEYFVVVGITANDIETVNNYLNNFKETGNYLFPPSFRNEMRSASYSSQELAYRKLIHYHVIRTRLYKLCGEIEDFFSLPILFCIGYCFVPFFYSLFRLFRYSHDDEEFESKIAGVSYIVRTILMYAYPVTSLALNITRVRKEAHITRQIVDTLWEVAIREEIISKLELFSRQLLHENISFTAYGFFSLDSSLLLSMLGGTATYFVALMQFPDNNCKYARNTTTELTTT